MSLCVAVCPLHAPDCQASQRRRLSSACPGLPGIADWPPCMWKQPPCEWIVVRMKNTIKNTNTTNSSNTMPGNHAWAWPGGLQKAIEQHKFAIGSNLIARAVFIPQTARNEWWASGGSVSSASERGPGSDHDRPAKFPPLVPPRISRQTPFILLFGWSSWTTELNWIELNWLTDWTEGFVGVDFWTDGLTDWIELMKGL